MGGSDWFIGSRSANKAGARKNGQNAGDREQGPPELFSRRRDQSHSETPLAGAGIMPSSRAMIPARHEHLNDNERKEDACKPR
jgi:hypothetical protein